MFLHALAEKLVVFGTSGAFVFHGTYADFLEKGGWEKYDDTVLADDGKNKPPVNKKQNRAVRAKRQKEKNAVLKPLTDKITALENQIDLMEKELDQMNEEMVTAVQKKNSRRIEQLQRDSHATREAIDQAFNMLESATAAHDEKAREWEDE